MSTAPQTASATRTRESSGKATAALITGIVGLALFFVPIFGFVLPVVAIVLGASARSDIRAKRLRGSGMATAGMTLGIISLLLSVGFVVLAMAS